MTNDKHDGTSGELVEADLPGLDDADSPAEELVEAALPGLDGADSPDETPEPPAELSDLEKFDRAVKEWEEGLDVKAASKPSSESWTDLEMEWWWYKAAIGRGPFSRHQHRFLRDFFWHENMDVEEWLRSGSGQVDLGPWRQMSHETKVRFRSAWDELFPPKPKESNDPDIPDEDSALTEMPSHLSMFEDDASPESELLSSMQAEDKKFDAARWAVPGEGYEESPKASIPRGIWIGGGVGALGLVLAIGFFAFGGSDVSDPATAVADAPAIAVEAEPEPAAGEAAAVLEEEPAGAIEEEPTPPVEEVPTLAVEDLGAHMNVTSVTAWVDANGDVYLKVFFAAPWPIDTPAAAAALNMQVLVGVTSDGQSNTTQWSLNDGKTRGAAFMFGDVQASIDGEMWVTPKGTLVVKLPGLSPTGGLSASDLSPSSGLVWSAQVILEEGGDIQRWDENTTLGEINQLSEPVPLPDWMPVATDFGPVTLIVPTG